MPWVQEATTPGTSSTSVGGGQQLVALAVGLHHRVLDAVVDHLREVPGAHRPGVHEAGAGHLVAGLVARRRRLERVEDRLDLGDVLGGAADHQRVAVLQAPDAAGDAGVDVADALLGASASACTLSSVNLELPPSTTTSPALSSSPSSRTVARVGSPEGTITQTTRGASRASTRASQAVDVPRARRAVVADHLVTGAAHPLGHVAAHLAQPDQPQLHVRRSSRVARRMRPFIVAASPASGRSRRARGRPQPGSRTGMIR